ncbi:MAG TPA: hypothetical protein VGR57_14600 [Ktedonobacterales bacterium]|nr:hypothetical protein [Ktedonobacterales bacterium]
MSSTAVNDIEEEDLPHELHVAYQDANYTLARLIALRYRVDPQDDLRRHMFTMIGYLANSEFDTIVAKAQAMLDTPAHPLIPRQSRRPR